MSVPQDNDIATNACASTLAQTPQPTPEELATQGSAGMAAMLQALGIESCKSFTAAGVSFFPPGVVGGQLDIGCEQIAAISQEMDASQKILQCSLTSSSQSKNLNATQSLIIDINAKNFNAEKCKLEFKQYSDMRVVNYSAISSDIKQQMEATVKSTMDQLIDVIQKQTKTGLFPASLSQKTIAAMSQNLDQMVQQNTITEIVQQQIEQYNNSARFTLELTNLNVCNNTGTIPAEPCFEVDQSFIMQILSQSILSSTLEQIFAGSAENAMKEMLKAAQIAESHGFTFPDFGGIALILGLVIVGIALLLAKKPDNGNGKESVLAGKVGTIFGSILMVVGVILAIVGVVLKLKNKANSILCYAMIAGGVILVIVGIVMLVKARSQQLEFEQKLEIARAKKA